jgi:hypothetical protein
MGQLYDWEGLLGHKRPTGMMSIFGALQFTTAMGLREELLPCRGLCPEPEHKAPCASKGRSWHLL